MMEITDNHQIYVIENDSPDPMQGEFRMKGAIMTNPDWNGEYIPQLLNIKGALSSMVRCLIGG